MSQRAQSLLDSQFSALDRNLHDFRDLARSSGLSHFSIELFSLLALKFICDHDIIENRESGKNSFQASDWRDMVPETRTDDLSERLLKLARAIETRYKSLDGVFTRNLLTDLPRWPGTFLHQVVFQLSALSLSFPSEKGIPGFARWFDNRLSFVMESNLASGPFATPRSIAQLMVKLADLSPGLSLLDPACGLGTMLACSAEVLCQPMKPCSLFGQEINIRSWALCRVRLFLLGYTIEQIACGDAIKHPAFVIDSEVRKFDRVLCDAPLGMHLDSQELQRADRYNRFRFLPRGRISGESAFVQHIIGSLAFGGIAVVLVSHGLLFRSGLDVRIREELARNSYIKAIIGLPGKLRTETAVETALIIFEKHASPHVFFIDATALQEKSRGRVRLSLETIETISQLQKNGEERPGISRAVSLDELAKADYSLVPKRYIGQTAQVRPNVESLRKELRSWESDYQKIVTEMEHLL